MAERSETDVPTMEEYSLMARAISLHIKPWHGCLSHNTNHCTECATCSCFEES